MTKHYDQRKEANKRYLSSLDEFKVRMAKGDKDKIKAHAESRSESLNGFILRAIDETIKRDKKELE